MKARRQSEKRLDCFETEDGCSTDTSSALLYSESMLGIYSTKVNSVFLAKTKGQRGVKIDDNFDDITQLTDEFHCVSEEAFDG